ncbi:hypothetical protein MHYP_G00284350 [Metynnis hypsauchen]
MNSSQKMKKERTENGDLALEYRQLGLAAMDRSKSRIQEQEVHQSSPVQLQRGYFVSPSGQQMEGWWAGAEGVKPQRFLQSKSFTPRISSSDPYLGVESGRLHLVRQVWTQHTVRRISVLYEQGIQPGSLCMAFRRKMPQRSLRSGAGWSR